MRLAELAEEAFVAINPEGKILEWNPAAEKIFQKPREEVLGQTAEDNLSLEPEEIKTEVLQQNKIEKASCFFKGRHLLLSAGKHKGDYHIFLSDKTERDQTQEKLEALEKSPDLMLLVFDQEECLKEWTGEEEIFGDLKREETLASLFMEKPDPQGKQQEALSRTGIPLLLDFSIGQDITLIVRDIHEKQDARQRAKTLETLLESSEEIVILMDTFGTIHSWNKAAEDLYGWSGEEALGEKISFIQNPSYKQKEDDSLALLLENNKTQRIEIERWAKDGQAIPVSTSLSRIPESGLISLVEHDLRNERRFENRLQFLAEHDDLTGLKNREGFMREILEKAHTDKDQSLLILDVDNFKFVNEAYGHDSGDKLLAMIGGELTDQDSARIGADQFALLLNESDIYKARTWGERFIEKLRKKARQDLRLPIGFSAGLVFLLPHDDRDGEEILNAAELALHQAKEKARGTIWINSSRERPVNWSRKLEAALSGENFLLYAQPIQDIRSSKVKSYELLLRLRDPDLGLVTPDRFLGTAEKLGLVSEIDRWVAHQGIRLAAQGLNVEINLSGRSMTDERLFDFIASEVEKSRPENIVFEITETTAIASMEDAVQFSEKIMALGCSFALDDFGVGFGSFSYLKHLPLEILKIDGEFVKNILNSKEDQAIISSIASLAQGLNLQTVAEWVDSEEAYKLLGNLGIDMAQGYWIGRPQSIEDILS